MLASKMQSAGSVNLDALAVGHANAPYVSVYEWTGNGLGSKFANPASAMTYAGTTVSFNPDGSALAVGGTGFSVYRWGYTGFGTKYTVPSNATSSQDVVFSRDGLTLVCNGRAYAWSSSGFGTDYGEASSLVIKAMHVNALNADSTVYTFQCVVQMDDNSVPVVGAYMAIGDFSVQANNTPQGGIVTPLGGGACACF